MYCKSKMIDICVAFNNTSHKSKHQAAKIPCDQGLLSWTVPLSMGCAILKKITRLGMLPILSIAQRYEWYWQWLWRLPVRHWYRFWYQNWNPWSWHYCFCRILIGIKCNAVTKQPANKKLTVSPNYSLLPSKIHLIYA